MIPAFNESGLLPPGIHWATLREIEIRFALNSHRKRLFAGLGKGLIALVDAGCRVIYLDGSFVAAKEYPSDYDACWEAAGVKVKDLDPVFRDFSNKRAAQKAKFSGEFFPAHFRAEIKSPFRTFLDFFQSDKYTGHQNGIFVITFKKFIL
jgi:hypothetical protein